MIGRKIIQLESVDSTNNYVAKLIIRNEIDHGTVILADEQTHGKGQRGAVWKSNPAENMIFSTFLRTENMSVQDQFVLTQMISVAAVKMLSKYGVQAVIKWPNDIYVNNKKIAGILIENQIQGKSLISVNVGVGLNVNQTLFEGVNATSLKLELSKFIPIQEVVFSFITELNGFWNMLVQLNYSELNKLYLSKLWKLNEIAIYEDATGVFEGVIVGTEQSGRLRVNKNGEIKMYDLKEIVFK